MFGKQLAVALSYGLLLASDVFPEVSSYAAAGAAGLLTFIVIYIIRDNAQARVERHAERDKDRAFLSDFQRQLHEDSIRLNQTLDALRSHCIETIAKREK